MEPPKYSDNPEKPEINKQSNKNRVIAAISGLALTLCIGLGIGSNLNKQPKQINTTTPSNTSQDVSEKQSSIDTSSVDSVETEKPPTAESLELNINLANDPNLLMQAFIDKTSSEWLQAGATLENAKKALKSGKTISEYAEEVALEYDYIFIDAILINDWKSNTSLVEYVQRMKSQHKMTLEAYFMTSFPDINPADKEPFKQWFKYGEVKYFTKTDKDIKVGFTSTLYANPEKNRMGELPGSESVKSQLPTNDATVTFVKYEDSLKMSNLVAGRISN
jgi:hypothetical protein